MKLTKISTLLAIATLPFLASCALWQTAKISSGLRDKNLSYEEAVEAIKNGADVSSKGLLYEAFKQKREDLVLLFIEHGANPVWSLWDSINSVKSDGAFDYSGWGQNDCIFKACCEFYKTHRTNDYFLNEVSEARKFYIDYVLDFEGREWRTKWNNGRRSLEVVEDSEGLNAAVRALNMIGDVLNEGALGDRMLRIRKANITQRLFSVCEDGEYYNFPERLERLFRVGANVHAKKQNGDTPLIVVLKSRRSNFHHSDDILMEDALIALISHGADVNELGADGHSPLYFAYKSEHIKVLADAGAKLTQSEATVLLTEIVKENKNFAGGYFTWNGLIQQGADVNAQIDGHSLLYVATANGSEFSSVLKDAGAKLLPEEEKTLQEKLQKDFAKAIGAGDVKAVERCIKAGVDVTAQIVGKDKDGKTCSPLFLAELASCKELWYPLAEIKKLLQDAGASKMSAEEMDMAYAVRLQKCLALVPLTGWDSIAEKVKCGELNLKANLNGLNAFHMLANCKMPSIDESFIAALKSAGVDINRKNGEDMSPLAMAIENANSRVVAVFLRHGANPNGYVPVKGAFGDAGQKRLMSFAIERYNFLVDRSRVDGEVDWDDIKNAKEIVSLMAQATGTEVTDL